MPSNLDYSRRRIAAAVLAVTLVVSPGVAQAVCSAIPAPPREFTTSIPSEDPEQPIVLGRIDRPFASPGDPVRIRCEPPGGTPPVPLAASELLCGPSPVEPTAERIVDVRRAVVSIVFQPDRIFTTDRARREAPPRHTVLVGHQATLMTLDACAPFSNDQVTCIADDGMSVTERYGIRALEFRFPDTAGGVCADGAAVHERCTTDGDCAGGACQQIASAAPFTGPSKIAVVLTGSAGASTLDLACDGGSTVVACIDHLNDDTFKQFTALPPPNDYGMLCQGPKDVCAGGLGQLLATVDVDGNLLVPVDWSKLVFGTPFDGLDTGDISLLRRIVDGLSFGTQSIELPVARLVLFQTTIDAFPGGRKQVIRLPDRSSLRSYTPGGVRLPPIFEPHVDSNNPGALVLFGSADAQRSVLRVARGCGHGQSPPDCLGTCDGGDFPGKPCETDCGCCRAGRCGTAEAPCGAPGTCKPGHFDFGSRLVGGVGPIVIARPAFDALERGAVSLDGLVQTDTLSAFVVHEALARVDLDQSGDLRQDVLIVQDRHNGAKLSIAADTSKGARMLDARPVLRVRAAPFEFHAVGAEDRARAGGRDIVAFLEPEGPPDINGDGDALDAILRVLHRSVRRDVMEAWSPSFAVDAVPVLNGRSFVVSDGLVMFRALEQVGADRVIRVTESPTGGDANGDSLGADISGDGRLVVFASDATNLTKEVDSNAKPDVFLRDLCMASGTDIPDCETRTERVSEDGGTFPSISHDGRFVAYLRVPSDGPNLSAHLLVYDRGTGATMRVSTSALSAVSAAPAIASHGNGFVVAFVDALDRTVHVYDSSEPCPSQDRCGLSISDGATPNTFGAAEWPAISDDGKWIAYVGYAPCGRGEGGGSKVCLEVLVYERDAAATHVVSVKASGEPSANAVSPPASIAISHDGRLVGFVSGQWDLDAGWEAPLRNAFVRDRAAEAGRGKTERTRDGGVSVLDLSSDGRVVAVARSTLDGDAYRRDVWITDRVTGMHTKLVSGTRHEAYYRRLALSGDGRVLAFDERQPNGDRTDVFVRGTTGSLTGRTVLKIMNADTGKIEFSCPATRVAVSKGAVAFVRPEWVPNASDSPGCPSGDLNGDGDTADEIVQLWTKEGGAVHVPAKAATAIALADGHVAALVSERGQAGARDAVDDDLDEDGDLDDDVVHVFEIAKAQWRNLKEAASRLDAAGGVVAFRAIHFGGSKDVLRFYVTSQGVTYGSETAVDFAIGPGTNVDGTTNATPLIAYRFPEASVCRPSGGLSCERTDGPTCATGVGLCDRNQDGDCCDDILKYYRFSTAGGSPQSSASAVTPCTFETCDPAVPYRVGKNTITFLTLTAQNDPVGQRSRSNDLVLQVLDTRASPPTRRVLGSVAAGKCTGDPRTCLTDADCHDGSRCHLVSGCVIDAGKPCKQDADCPDTFLCEQVPEEPDDDDAGRCLRRDHSCVNDEQCEHLLPPEETLPGATARCSNGPDAARRLASPLTAPLGGGQFFTTVGSCENDPGAACGTDNDCGNSSDSKCTFGPVVAAAADSDGDEIPDVFDVCPAVDGADACPAGPSCGDGVVTRPFEICDDGPGGSSGSGAQCINCTSVCPPTMRSGCHVAGPGDGARLVMQRRSARSSSLAFRWPDAPVTLDALGDPVTTASYALCVYDGSAPSQPVREFQAFAGGSCGTGTCWRRRGTRGFTYKDASRGGGITSLHITTGGIKLSARGPDVAPAMPASTPVTVQLVNTQTAACWEARVAEPRKNSASEFRSR